MLKVDKAIKKVKKKKSKLPFIPNLKIEESIPSATLSVT